MSFLPENYEAPKEESNYFKLKKGENKFRILSGAITGYEYWNTFKKPVRSTTPFKGVPADAQMNDQGQFAPKHFWAFIVWNYEAEKVQILEVTQKTVMQSIGSYVDNAKWGDPKGYDFVVTATGDGMDREYNVIVEPHSPAPEADISKIKLEALFVSGDPFNENAPAKTGIEYPTEEIKAEDIPF